MYLFAVGFCPGHHYSPQNSFAQVSNNLPIVGNIVAVVGVPIAFASVYWNGDVAAMATDTNGSFQLVLI